MVEVVGATVAVVAVVAEAGGAVVGATVDWCVEVSAVAAVSARVATPVVVVVVDRAVDALGPGRPVAPGPWAPCASLDAAPAKPGPVLGTCFGLPAVATRSAIRASDTARMTHQLGRLRAILGRRPSEDTVP